MPQTQIIVRDPCPPGCTSAGCGVDHYTTHQVDHGVVIERVDGIWEIHATSEIDLAEIRRALDYLHGF